MKVKVTVRFDTRDDPPIANMTLAEIDAALREGMPAGARLITEEDKE